jgi:predicted AlkP superfamily phosphohydrolase/phosphomutase/tetratricopeptide (TPR) repeat protein
MARVAKKVLLIGWDAADWKVINPLIDSGDMPAMEKLVNGGVMGNITTLEPPFSPILWTSIATGKYADKHGVLGFTEPNPDGLGMRPVSSYSRKTKAIWNILSQNGLKSHVLGWWPSNPVETINGIMISNHFSHSRGKLRQPWPIVPGSIHPKELEEFLAEFRVNPQELTSEHLLPFVPDAAKIDQEKDHRLRAIATNLAEASSLHSIATWILDTQPWDFLAIYLDSIDHFCHGFMKYHPPRLSNIPEEDFELYKGVVTAAYRYHDMMLENLMKLAGDDTTIILISDHGFQSDHFRTTFVPDEPAGPADHHREHGIICINGPGIKKDELIYGSSLLNVTPTILTLFGLPIGRDMDGVPVVQAFEKQPLIEVIPSWDEIRGAGGMLPENVRVDPIESSKALQQLIELGYVEDPGPDKQKAAETAVLESQYNLARVYMGSFRYFDALNILQDIIKEHEEQGRFTLRLARCYYETGKYNEAVATLERFMKIGIEKNINLEKLKVELDEKTKNSPKDKKKNELEFQKKVRTQITLQNSLAQADMMLFDLKILKEKPKEIIERIEKQFSKGPIPISFQGKLANLYLKQKKFKKAEEFFNKLIEYNPENAFSHNGLASALLGQKRFEEAANKALDAIGLNYYFPIAHYNLGEALSNLHDYENAANAYEVSLKILPSLGAARNKLIKIYTSNLKKPELAAVHSDFFNTKNIPAEERSFEVAEFSDMQSKFMKFDNPVIVVSGLPRSGTSLMMQMLEAGGVPIFSDNVRKPDENNPRGYYEHEAVKSMAKNKKWLSQTPGKAVKIVSHLLVHLPAKYNYKVIFMLRDLPEIVTSQHRMLVRKGKHREDVYPGRLEIVYKNHLRKASEWLKANHNAAVLYINHQDAINNPVDTAEKVKQFLGIDLDIVKMASVIDKKLYREKKV